MTNGLMIKKKEGILVVSNQDSVAQFYKLGQTLKKVLGGVYVCYKAYIVSGATIALCQGPEHQILCTVSLFIHTVFMLDFVPRTN